jgi:hypothetical protein
MFVILALGRLRQEDGEVEARLGSIVRLSQNQTKPNAIMMINQTQN